VKLRLLKVAIFLVCLVPLARLGLKGLHGELGANPIEVITHSTGDWTMILLLATLSITPLRMLTRQYWIIGVRRMLGLFAFFYGCMHLVTYSIFDKSLGFSAIVADVIQRPFIAIGMIAFTILVPLAITSTNGMVKRLGGKNWARLHKLTYVAATLGVIHFWMIVKSDIFYPALFGVVLATSFLIRLAWPKKVAVQRAVN